MLKVITVTNNFEATSQLVQSLERNGWDWIAIKCEWRGFSTKLIETYNYLKANPEVDEFVFCDAFDVVALGSPDEFDFARRKMYPYADIICSAERGLWPSILEPYRDDYKTYPHGFNYINSGCYCGISSHFIDVMEKNMPSYETDDQFWFNTTYLNQSGVSISIDANQILFNSHSFISEGEYRYDNGRVHINGNQPIFIHSNGRTVDPKLDELLASII